THLRHHHFLALHAKHPLIFVRENLDELVEHVVPVFENPGTARASGCFHMTLNQRAEGFHIFRGYGLQIHGGAIAAPFGEIALLIENVREAAAHAGREVAPALAEYHYVALGHVFAAVIAEAFDDRGRARVADGEAFTGHPVEESLTTGGAVERRV